MVMLSAMRPTDPRYTVLQLAEAPDVDARLAYVLAGWPVMDPHARMVFAERIDRSHPPTQQSGPFRSPQVMRQRIVHAQLGYFGTRDVMREASPRLILERGEAVDLPPTLLLH